MIKTGLKILGILLLLVFVIAIIFIACKDNSINPTTNETNGNNDFSFKVVVKDTAGNPVNGLRVSAWNILSVDGIMYKADNPKLSKNSTTTSSTTVLGFTAATDAKVKFSVFNLGGQQIATLIDTQVIRGEYSILWTTPSSVPSGVYKCRLVATKTTSDSVLFQDSIYAVLHNWDPEATIIGWTSQEGIFETNEALLFPSVLDPPLLIRTSVGPEPIGTFEYTDSVTIVLTDTVTQRQQITNVAIGKQKNSYNLTWNSPSGQPKINKQDVRILTKRSSAVDANITFYVTRTGIAIGLKNTVEFKALQVDLEHITSTPTSIQSQFSQSVAQLDGNILRVIIFDQNKILAPGNYIIAEIQVQIDYPLVVSVKDIVAAGKDYQALNITYDIVLKAAFPSEWKLNQNYPNPFN